MLRLLNKKITYIPRNNKLCLVLGDDVAIVSEHEAIIRINGKKKTYYSSNRLELEILVEKLLLRAYGLKLVI